VSRRVPKVPALVGRTECARILGVRSENLGKVRGLPAPLQDRGIDGFDVGATPLWTRFEIERLRDERTEAAA
jgi:hypothetical protein